jgi:hypothetical protein
MQILRQQITALSIITIFSRPQAALFCSVLAALSIVIGYLLFRPLSWRQFLGRSPLFLATGVPLFLMALYYLPEALQTLFERYLGHSIYEMVYEHQSSGTVFGELWTDRWWGHVATVLDFAIILSAVWAIVNLSRRHAVRSNALALLLIFGWICLIVWATTNRILF